MRQMPCAGDILQAQWLFSSLLSIMDVLYECNLQP